MRQFLSQSYPDRKGLIFITGKDFRYMRQVLRTKPGDMVSIRLPDGTLQNTTVAQISEETRTLTLQVCSSKCSLTEKPESSEKHCVSAAQISANLNATEYWLFQFIAKPAKMEQIIRQAVECGVSCIVPIEGVFSQKQNIQAMNSTKGQRIERIIKEARQQSGSPIDTKVLPPMSLKDACLLWKDAVQTKPDNAAVALWERTEKSQPIHRIIGQKNVEMAVIAAGCEGGISSDEIEIMSEYGFVPVHFAVNILRCETAALYGIAAVQSAILENKSWVYRE